MIELQHPEALMVDGKWFGGSQTWYPKYWQRMGGCGATAASLLVWYLAQTRPRCAALCPIQRRSKSEFLSIMNEMFTCITPGFRGVNTSSKFSAGLYLYLKRYGIMCDGLSCYDIVPQKRHVSAAERHVAQELQADRPVAFLNLHSGNQKHLDGWHWTVLTAFDPKNGNAKLCDQGAEIEFSLRDWLQTTKRGGAFVNINELREENEHEILCFTG
ncbi:MAG: hypothetical protein LBG83_04640 [Oscillospiraceae bacterium]|nr:hypothetical protein [Oscillospiraceae bacterium]